MDLSNYDLTGEEPDVELVAGKYLCVIAESSEHETKKGDGRYLKLEWHVLTPENLRGSRIWQIFNLDNPSAKAMQIARVELGRVVRACGLTKVEDSQQLHDKQAVLEIEADGKFWRVVGVEARRAEPKASPSSKLKPGSRTVEVEEIPF